MSTLEERILRKIPGEDTGISLHNTFCDVCSPGPNCGVTCYLKDGKIIKLEGTDAHPTNHGLLCPKGQAGRQYVYRADRLTTPLRRVGERGEGKFEPISWDEAYDEICTRLNEAKAKYGASSVVFYGGYNKWFRPFLQRLAYSFGSVNYGTESATCFTSTIMSWKCATGESFCSPDLKNAGLFLGWAYNAYHSSYLQQKGVEFNRRRGMKVIIVDPRVTPAVEKQCDLFLRIRPGTDCALALCFGRELIVNDWIDHDYIEKNVYGFEQYRDYVMKFTPEYTETITDVPAEKIRLAVRMIHENMPLANNQSSATLVHNLNGMQTHRAIMALSAITGCYDRPGGQVPAPLTYAHSMAGFSTLDEEFPQEKYPKGEPRPVGAVRFPLWDELIGEMQTVDLSRQILEGTPYPIKAMYCHGLNYRMVNGDKKLYEALKQLDFLVDTDLFLTDSAKLADIVLPCCTSYERNEFKVVGPGMAQYATRAIEPVGESRQDDEIMCELARRLNLDDDLLKAGPEACVRYIIRNTPIDMDFLKAHSELPQKIPGIKMIPAGQHGFHTPTGKFELWSTIIEKYPQLDPLPTYKDGADDADRTKYPYILVGGARIPTALHSRVHDVPWLRSMRPDPTADISLEDAERLGLKRGDDITISTETGSITVKANPSSRIKKGTIFMYHGYREADVNSIISPTHNDPYSGFPGYRSVRCSCEPVRKEARR